MFQIINDNELQIIRIEHLREITHPLETEVSPLFDGNILFKVDSLTGE